MLRLMQPCWRKAKKTEEKAPNRAAEMRYGFDPRQLHIDIKMKLRGKGMHIFSPGHTGHGRVKS